MHTNEIRPLRSYRATLVPKGLDINQVESGSAALPTIQLKARCADRAEAAAHHVTGLRVVSVQQVSQVTGAHLQSLVDQIRAGEAQLKAQRMGAGRVEGGAA